MCCLHMRVAWLTVTEAPMPCAIVLMVGCGVDTSINAMCDCTAGGLGSRRSPVLIIQGYGGWTGLYSTMAATLERGHCEGVSTLFTLRYNVLSGPQP